MSTSSSWDKIFFFTSFLGLCFAIEVSQDGKSLITNGERHIIFSRAVHYPRSTMEMWPDIIKRLRIEVLMPLKLISFGITMNLFDERKAYVKWCAQMALAQNIGVPWFMCQQDDAPKGITNTCNGYHYDTLQPNNIKSTKMWTENWIGWFHKWGQRNPHRTVEDVAYSVAHFF
ncbi:hypothetical protein K1719_036278 [Acacia pycnantha]|nr:hypothetical protein K1719_036278 [Acacia pycnantha]